MTFLDLCVNCTDEARPECSRALQALGYAAVCWETQVSGRVAGWDRHVGGAAGSLAGAPTALFTREYSRISIHLEEEAQVFALQGARDVLCSYDLVAVAACSEAVLERCLSPPAVELIDVVTIPSHERPAFQLKRALVRRAARAGLSFELAYGACLKDSASRRNFVTHMQAARGDDLALAPRPRQRRTRRARVRRRRWSRCCPVTGAASGAAASCCRAAPTSPASSARHMT